MLGVYYERLVREVFLRGWYLIRKLIKGVNVNYLKSWWKICKIMSKCIDCVGKGIFEEEKLGVVLV